MVTPSFFSKNQIFIKQNNDTRFRYRVEMHRVKYGVHKFIFIFKN